MDNKKTSGVRKSWFFWLGNSNMRYFESIVQQKGKLEGPMVTGHPVSADCITGNARITSTSPDLA
ncbi:MAG: hypothetical protein L0Y43_02940 [Methylococcaceae bacterium]|nr:hypothetical protein [Methylococcaceae bacterium]